MTRMISIGLLRNQWERGSAGAGYGAAPAMALYDR
jgi:hypothetical protein